MLTRQKDFFGEFLDTVYGAENIEQIRLQDIYKIYDASKTPEEPGVEASWIAAGNDASGWTGTGKGLAFWQARLPENQDQPRFLRGGGAQRLSRRSQHP